MSWVYRWNHIKKLVKLVGKHYRGRIFIEIVEIFGDLNEKSTPLNLNPFLFVKKIIDLISVMNHHGLI